MAEPSNNTSNDTNAKAKKKQTKFGMMIGTMGRSAKKGLSRASKQMAKGAVKAKQAAAEKIAKVPVSEEDPEIISALEQLKKTKTDLYAISEDTRSLYQLRMKEAEVLLQLVEKLKSTKRTQNDPFTAYIKQMGVVLSDIQKAQSEHLKRMEEELVIPLDRFRDVDVEEVQSMKLKYKSGKTHYDITAHKFTKAKESNDAGKIHAAQQGKDKGYTQLKALRNELKSQVRNLDQKKQIDLLQSVEEYWLSYASFANAQSDILSQNTIEKAKYVPPESSAPILSDNESNDIMMFISSHMPSKEGIPPSNEKENHSNEGYDENNPFDGPQNENENHSHKPYDKNNPFDTVNDNSETNDYDNDNPFDDN